MKKDIFVILDDLKKINTNSEFTSNARWDKEGIDILIHEVENMIRELISLKDEDSENNNLFLQKIKEKDREIEELLEINSKCSISREEFECLMSERKKMRRALRLSDSLFRSRN
jgi:hypothetical protein